jgi:hypothetical protein
MEPLSIIIDSREQSPWAWEPSDAVTRIAGLAAGDYALEADTEQPKRRGAMLAVRFAIERKSLEDFLGTISTGWERFLRELTRMEAFPARVVIVEGDFSACCFREVGGDVLAPEHNHPQLRPAFVARRIAELTMMGVSVLMAGDAALAAGLAYRVFRRRVEACQQ